MENPLTLVAEAGAIENSFGRSPYVMSMKEKISLEKKEMKNKSDRGLS